MATFVKIVIGVAVLAALAFFLTPFIKHFLARPGETRHDEAAVAPPTAPSVPAQTPSSPSSELPTVATQAPEQSATPDDTHYFLLKRIVVDTDAGIYAISPGTVVTVASREGTKVHIISGEHETVVDAMDLTRNRTVLNALYPSLKTK